jgi:AcrR family transcriptional regulator
MGKLQDERREETRRRLLDATVACLFERGYAGTTTAEVAQRAGVSKGAQLYHFPKKDDLVIAALEYLLDQRTLASRKILAALPKDRKRRIAAIVDGLWPVYQGVTFYAWLELAVASRTDIALRQAVFRVSQKFSDEVTRMWQTIFSDLTAQPLEFAVLSQFINGQLAALALSRILTESADSEELKGTLAALKEASNFLVERMSAHRRSRS